MLPGTAVRFNGKLGEEAPDWREQMAAAGRAGGGEEVAVEGVE